MKKFSGKNRLAVIALAVMIGVAAECKRVSTESF